MNERISFDNSEIIVSQTAENELSNWINSMAYSKIFILVDENTHAHCLTKFLKNFPTELPIEVIEIPAGEENKTITTCVQVWESLAYLKADRNSVLINLGGGVVTDLGGFIASTYRRGIDFFHFPTSLLAMVDAAIGGKNGVDLGSLKNQVGVIQFPTKVYVNTTYLNTLPPKEMKSGLAEMLKHGLIKDLAYWEKFEQMHQMNISALDELILESIQIKSSIVQKDPNENGLRKTLNFGHTLGHAIESHFLNHPQKYLLHGEAIAVGMILASFLSVQLNQFSENDLRRISALIGKYFTKIEFTSKDISQIIELTKFDKKNFGNQVNFVLLNQIGKCKIDCQVPESLINDAFNYYDGLKL